MGGGNGQKSATSRARNQAKLDAEKSGGGGKDGRLGGFQRPLKGCGRFKGNEMKIKENHGNMDVSSGFQLFQLFSNRKNTCFQGLRGI